MDTEAAAWRWADVLREAWPAGDVERFVALYSGDAVFSQPPREAEPAAEHLRRALALGEPGPSVWVGEPVVHGSWAAIEWWAVIVIEGEPKTFGGTAWVRFDADGLVVEERDYVQAAAGRFEPWAGWGTT